MTLHEKLRHLRSLEKLPQHMIADILQVERSTYSYYEKGKTTPSVYALFALSKLYDLPMEFFVDDNWELDGADAFLQSHMQMHGHKNSETARELLKHMDYYKKLMRYKKKKNGK